MKRAGSQRGAASTDGATEMRGSSVSLRLAQNSSQGAIVRKAERDLPR